jgi:hypothetical protein
MHALLNGSKRPEILSSLPQAEAVVRPTENTICVRVILTVVVPETDLADLVLPSSE